MQEKSPFGRRYDREFKENAGAPVRGGKRVATVAEALEVSRSGFFAHQRKREKPRRQEDRALAERIQPGPEQETDVKPARDQLHAVKQPDGAAADDGDPSRRP